MGACHTNGFDQARVGAPSGSMEVNHIEIPCGRHNRTVSIVDPIHLKPSLRTQDCHCAY